MDGENGIFTELFQVLNLQNLSIGTILLHKYTVRENKYENSYRDH